MTDICINDQKRNEGREGNQREEKVISNHDQDSEQISSNKLEGQIPSSFYQLKNLETLSLSRNLLSVLFNPHSKLQSIYLYNNKLKGFLPIPPPSILEYDVSNNALEERNCFGGPIPDIWTNGCHIRAMMLSDNLFEGELPRSLANCTWLDTLDVGNNQIKDTFPFWMATLPDLNVLVLQFNKFSGVIKDPDHQNKTAIFPKLHIVDLSHNSFSGPLPHGYIQIWDAMKVFVEDDSNYYVKITITNKGTAREYWEIQNSLNLLDLSNNRSHPIIFGELSKLEVLDLAHNKLSGEIPQQLTQLNFLGTFNVAQNNLVGPIPHGKQFDTFLNSSYEGNAGLCGKPLSKECGNLKDSPPPSSIVEEEEEKGPALEFGWKPVVIQYICGLVIGIAEKFPHILQSLIFSVAHNNLRGNYIPYGKQFGTFPNSSFEGNIGLCGNPLSNKYGNMKENLLADIPTSTDEAAGCDSSDAFSHTKLTSEKTEGHNTSNDCCSWNGMVCNEDTGHVVGPDVNSGYLYGHINSNTSLFQPFSSSKA
ncbi:receptor-like protein Cf-9 homolog [Ziziphus jujuba]|uniref:Receptor-like protein Cf-9 homolog n=1 Tax=Ziziphus jujuba TaxID=326968 RepID=A0ABM4A7N0_ZIZJJ|nr:receptor-like protein Cf-9 homolog [Ziziphus jujuba]